MELIDEPSEDISLTKVIGALIFKISSRKKEEEALL